MQIKKEILLFFGLLFLSAGLLIASGLQKQPGQNLQPCKEPVKCCQEQVKTTSPWNFITESVLHIAA